MNYPALLSFICGFASLSAEILWVRLYSFARFSMPAAFGFVLMAFLLGIALGAHLGSRACRRERSDAALWSYSVAALVLSAALTVLLPTLFGWMTFNGIEDPLSALVVIAAASCVLAFVFPIAHHLGADRRGEQQGRRFATVYAANVMGAALGPLVTGYVLLDLFTLQHSFAIVSLVQLGAAVFFASAIAGAPFRRVLGGLGLALFIGVGMSARTADPHALIQQVNELASHAKTVIENRHGVITLFSKKEGDDAVFGGNVYDGRTNLDPELNTNGLERPLLLAVLKPTPKRVLMVGLSIGTWLALVNEFPGVEQVDVVEINPGYLEAARAYPGQASAMHDPRVNIVVDDARRWLRHHPGRQYDLVVMNTTQHWRANSSLLLSTEFLKIVQGVMAPGAVMTFNATGSGDAFLTATKVFGHAYRYSNFVYAAEFDFRERKDSQAARDVYVNLKMAGRPLFAPGSAAIDRFLGRRFVTIEQAQKAAERQFEPVTDQNMITEFKYGLRLY